MILRGDPEPEGAGNQVAVFEFLKNFSQSGVLITTKCFRVYNQEYDKQSQQLVWFLSPGGPRPRWGQCAS